MSRLPTIAGVATGTADGGVAIVRISGPQAREIAEAVLEGSLPKPRRAGLRRLVVGDSALVLSMPGPGSLTGEDVVELQVHAGARNVAEVLEAVLAAGAEAAGPGDFSRRAFVHGRLSLDQAEGIAAVIGATTRAALDQARRLVAGELGREVEAVRAAAERLRVEIEANLDFPEDVRAEDELRFAATSARLHGEVTGWLARFEAGRRARARARVVLAGPPNAGKSALFNALLGRRRALVSPRAGTTRDYLEGELELGGRELVLIDTAGLRSDADELESAGAELGREQIAGADVVVWVEARDQPAADRLTAEALAGAALLEVENKLDLPVEANEANEAVEAVDAVAASRAGWIGVSAATGAGLEALRDALTTAVATGDEQWIGLARHRDRAAEAAAALAEARAQLEAQAGLELVAFALAVAQRRLGEITGRTGLGPVGEELLAAIFSSFCIGK